MIGALDLATVSGWCLPGPSGTFRTGEWDFTPKPATKRRPAEPDGLRFWKLHRVLHTWLVDNEVEGLIIESTHSRSKRATEVLYGFVVVTEVLCHELHLEYVFAEASTVKSFARTEGVEAELVTKMKKGKPKELPSMKEPMRRAACSALGRDVTDNESDAYWLLRWYQRNRTDALQEMLL